MKTQDYLREFVSLFFIRKNIIIGTTIIFTILAFLIVLFYPPIYQSKGSILVKRSQPIKTPESVEKVPIELIQVTQEDLLTEKEIISSTTVVENTAKVLRKKNLSFYQNKSMQEKAYLRLASKISQNLSMETAPKANVIKVGLTWGDSQEAKTILDTLFQVYLDYRQELYNPKEAMSFFQNNLHQFNEALKKKEDKLLQLAEKNNVSAPMEQIRSNLLIYKSLENELIDLETKQTEISNYIQNIQSSLQSRDINFFTSVDNMEIGDLGKKLQGLVMEKEKILQVYTEQSPKAKRINRQIQTVCQGLKNEVQRNIDAQKAKLSAIQKNIAMIKPKIRNLEQRNLELYKNMVMNNRINREINLLEDSYTTFSKRLQEAQITARSKAGKLFSVSILSSPNTPLVPVFPDKRKVIPLGFVLGLIVGATVGFLLEFFDHSFKRPEDVYNYTDLPYVYSIPKF